MGDGDSVTIGGNHFIHAARRNIDLTAIVLNNLNYGMTGGQVSGTTPEWAFTSTTAYGNPEREFDICALAETAGANYVARSTPYHGWEMKEIIKQALGKKGFSLVEVVSPCPTHFGRNNEMKETPEMLRMAGRTRDAGRTLSRAGAEPSARIIFRSARWSTGTSRISTRATTRCARAPSRNERAAQR